MGFAFPTWWQGPGCFPKNGFFFSPERFRWNLRAEETLKTGHPMTGPWKVSATGCASYNTHERNITMKKYLLATTAAVSILAAPVAFAQDSNNAGAMDNTSIFSQEPYAGEAPAGGFYAASSDQILATRFIGANIYTGTGDEAETVGDVNDIIMTPDGRAVAVIAGVGGFLGIGEKEVAVSIDELSWKTDADGDHVLVGQFTKEQLENAPGFDRDALNADRQSAEMPADKTMNADETAEADQPAQDQQMAENKADDTTMAADGEPDSSTVTASTPRMETTPAAEAQFEASELIGMKVVGANDEDVGEVGDVLVNDGGKIEAFIIDVGGFLGMNEKPVAVSMKDLQFARIEGSDDWSEIKTGLTKEALESQEAYSKDLYASDSDAVILVAPAE